MSIAFLLFFNVVFLIIMIFFAIIPFVTRKIESFGVTIPEEVYDSPEVVSIRKSYINSVVIFGIVFLALLNVLFYFFPGVIINIIAVRSLTKF